MILQALYHYYEAMRRAGRIATPGLEYKPIRWQIVLQEDGSFVRIEDHKDPEDKKSKGEMLLVPIGLKRSGQKPPAQLFWDNRKYILGYEEKDGVVTPTPERMEDFVTQMKEIARQYEDNRSFRAVSLFYDRYKGSETPLPIDEGTSQIAASDWITFRLQGENDPVATQKDAHDYASKTYESGERIGRCLVTGESLPLADFHARILAPGSQAGSTIASFNDDAYLSYGKKQGANAPISKRASFAHTTALNSLLSTPETHYALGDISYVFWNSDATDNELNDTFRTVAFGVGIKGEEEDEEEDDQQPKRRRGKRRTKATAPSPTQGTYQVMEHFKAIRGNKGAGLHQEDNRHFYILGLSAGGRISIKYWQRGTVQEIFDHVYRHLQDMNIIRRDGLLDEEMPPLRSLYGIVKTISAPSSQLDASADTLIQSVVESILSGLPYPQTLQQACIGRILHDGNVTELRAAILKGCVNRKERFYHHHPDTVHMALDKENDNIAYLSGRIFAVLEKLQQASLGYGVNATIRDRFYGSASTRPGTVMGRLISLSNHHLSKLRKDKPGLAVYFERLLEEIFAMIPATDPVFPATFSLDEQSLFAVGYYHQKADRKSEADKEETEAPDEEPVSETKQASLFG